MRSRTITIILHSTTGWSCRIIEHIYYASSSIHVDHRALETLLHVFWDTWKALYKAISHLSRNMELRDLLLCAQSLTRTPKEDNIAAITRLPQDVVDRLQTPTDLSALSQEACNEEVTTSAYVRCLVESS